jgi:hypothetical protein
MRAILAITVILVAISACNSQSPRPLAEAIDHVKAVHAQKRSFDVSEASVEPTRLEADAYVTRSALRVAYPNRAAHDMRVELRHSIAKGGGDTSITIEDMTAAASAQFVVSEEDASAHILFKETNLPFAVNPDKTITVAGQTFPDTKSAAAALSQHPALASMPPEIVATLQQTMVDSLGINVPTAKWEVVVEVAVAILVDVAIRTTCDWGCNQFNGGAYCQTACEVIGQAADALVDALI